MRWIVLLFVLMLPSLVLAGTISLTTSVTTDILTSNQGQVQITLTNSGDEAAHNVQLSLVADYFSSNPVRVGTLEVNKPFKANITVAATKTLKEGNYPVVVMTDYTDANGYPFSSVSPITLTYKNPYPSRVTGAFENVELSGKNARNLVLKLKNMDQVAHDVNVKLILPNELSSDLTETVVSLNSKEEKQIPFKISNFAGLEGSTYVVLAKLEYEDDYHHSSLSSGIVKIVEARTFAIPPWFPIVAAIILIAVFAIYQLRKQFTIKIKKA